MKIRNFDVEKLKEENAQNNFQLKLTNRFQILSIIEDEQGERDWKEVINHKWRDIEETVREVSEEEIGYVQGRRRNTWYDGECREAVDRKKEAKILCLQRPEDEELREIERQRGREVHTVMRRKKRQAIHKELDEIDKDRKEGRIRRHYQGVRKIRKGYQARPNMVKGENGEIITDDNKVIERWMTYFEKVLNRPEPENPVEPIIPFGPEIEIEAPTRYDVKNAIKKLRNNKSPGIDNIPAEIWKYGGQ